jgi:hypothetical protein
MKHDHGKTPFGLIPPEALAEVANVLGFGAEKYGMNNWRDDGDTTSWVRTYSSAQRHLNAWLGGEDNDPESNLPHLAHACTQLMILITHSKFNPASDDRYVPLKREHQ